MKFDKVAPKIPWTAKRTKDAISLVWEEVAAFNQELNSIDSKVSALLETKMIVRRKIANKHRYRNQLEQQLIEIEFNEGDENAEWVEPNTEQNVQVSDTTEDDSSTGAGNQKTFYNPNK